MKKLLFAMLLVLAMAIPAVAQDSTSWVTGGATQNNGASISIPSTPGTYPAPQGAFATGGQNNSASFSAYPYSPSGEDASGSISLNGTTTVTASVKGNSTSNTSSAYGTTNNAGTVTVDASTGSTNNSLYGTGTMQTGTISAFGATTTTGSTVSLIGNGAIAGTSTNGSFGYSASGGPGWSGNGSTTGTGSSTTSAITNGFSASSSATVTSVACPKK